MDVNQLEGILKVFAKLYDHVRNTVRIRITREETLHDILMTYRDVLQISKAQAKGYSDVLADRDIVLLGELCHFTETGGSLYDIPEFGLRGRKAIETLLEMEKHPVHFVSISTTGISIEQKAILATSSVAKDMHEVALHQLRSGGVIIDF